MNAITLLDLCAHTYSRSEIESGPLGRDGANVFSYEDGTVVVAFRGTTVNHDAASLIDWVNDFTADLVSDAAYPGKVHEGFRDALGGLIGGVFSALEKIDNQERMYITGHSKGGALAQLAGVILSSHLPQVVTFASPMVGNQLFGDYYPTAAHVTRYESLLDIVPHLPLDMLGYYPVGNVVHEKPAPADSRRWHIGKYLSDVEQVGERIAHAHHIATGYRPWIEGSNPPASEARAA